MNKLKSRLSLYGILPLAAAAISAVMVYIGYTRNSDLIPIDNVYIALLFKENFFTGAIIGFLLFAIVMAFSAMISFKKCTVSPQPKGTPIIFARSAVGLFFIGTVAMQFLLNTSGTPYPLDGIAANYQKISLVAALFASLYFLLPIFTSKQKTVQMVLGIAVLAWLTMQLIVTHYFMSEFLSSPNRILPILSLAALLFFILAELRVLRFKNSSPGFYIATGLTAFLLTFAESAPRLILSFTGEAGMRVDLSSFYTLLRLALGFYAFFSAFSAVLEAVPMKTPHEETSTEYAEEIEEHKEEPSSTEETPTAEECCLEDAAEETTNTENTETEESVETTNTEQE